MDQVFSGLAIVATCLGVVLALAHVTGWLYLAARGRSNRPELAPMGYIGVGLALSMVAFYPARGLSQGSWGSVDDLAGLMIVLAVASWGFGAAYEWASSRLSTFRVRWPAPLLLSCVTGLFVGLAAGPLGV